MEQPGAVDFSAVAQYLQHPLVLAGFALFLIVGLYKSLVASGVIPKLRQADAPRVVVLFLNHGFVLGLVIVLLGFALAFFQQAQGQPALQWGALGSAAVVSLGGVAALLRAVRPSSEFDPNKAFDALIAGHERERSRLEGDLRAKDDENRALRAALEGVGREVRSGEASPALVAAAKRAERGDARPLQKVLAETVERRVAEGRSAYAEAAQAARQLGALAYFDDSTAALAAYRRAAELDPDDVWTWIFIARLEMAQGRSGEATMAALWALNLARHRGDDRDAAVAAAELGDIRQAQGNLADALAAYEDVRAVAERLAAADPGNAEWQRDLSISWDRVGDVRRAQGDLAAALAAYEDGRAIRERLAAADPGNAGWPRDLSVSWIKVGDARRAQGDLAAALAAYEDGRAIRERLAAADPANAGWQRDLSISWERVASVREGQGEWADAAEAWRRALAISEPLAARVRDDVAVATTPVIHLAGLARALTAVDPPDRAQAVPLLDRALGILRPLASAGRLDHQRAGWVAWIEAERTALEANGG